MPKRWIAWGVYWFAVFVGMRGAAHASEGEERWRVVETIGDPRELTCVFADGDALWFGALGSGMLRVTGGRTERFGARAGLPGARVRDCQREGESIGVATEAGVARWEASSQRFATLARGSWSLITAEGLSGNEVHDAVLFEGRSGSRPMRG